MGLYCSAHWCLSSSVTRVGVWLPPGRARGRSGGRHCMAGQYGYVLLGRHLVQISSGFCVPKFTKIKKKGNIYVLYHRAYVGYMYVFNGTVYIR